MNNIYFRIQCGSCLIKIGLSDETLIFSKGFYLSRFHIRNLWLHGPWPGIMIRECFRMTWPNYQQEDRWSNVGLAFIHSLQWSWGKNIHLLMHRKRKGEWKMTNMVFYVYVWEEIMLRSRLSDRERVEAITR